MQITDTIADLLTRIRNAASAKHETVEIPASNMKKAIVEILFDEGYIKKFVVSEDGKQGIIKIFLKRLVSHIYFFKSNFSKNDRNTSTPFPRKSNLDFLCKFL